MKILFILFFSMIFVVGCSKSSEEIKMPPVFKSSVPEDNAVDISVSTIIEITYDEVISLAPNHGITLNNQDVEVETSLTKLIFNTTLSASTTYSIKIPVGAVINSFGVASTEEFHFSFTTEDETVVNIDANLVSTNPSSQAVNVYNLLKEYYGNKCLSSTHANVNWNLNEAEWVKQYTGKYPVIATFDYIHLPASPANWIDYSDISFVEEWWNNNGLVSVDWHWMVPRYEGDVEINSYTYSPQETTFKASNVIIDGTWENTVAKADLEEIAGYLKLLQAKNIPVIWRPFHEAAGNIYEYNGGTAWFWWGDEGADTYKNLWIYMFDYFEAQGLNNLIWVWTTQTKDKYFYPGDEYVDIIGRDIYNNSDATDIANQFSLIQNGYPNKMVTLSELGNVAKISDQWSAGAKWSYFMPWYDYDRTKDTNGSAFTSTDHQHANAAWWTDAFSMDYVIFRDEMPNLK